MPDKLTCIHKVKAAGVSSMCKKHNQYLAGQTCERCSDYKPATDKITEILRELVEKAGDKAIGYLGETEDMKEDIARARTLIVEEFLRLVGEDLIVEMVMNNPLMAEHARGYNKRGQEIRKKMEEKTL